MIPGWRELFCASDAPPDFTLPRRIVRLRGEPSLLLPPQHARAARALDLYPAQTLCARTARELLRNALRVGLPVPLERFNGPVHEAAPFVQFLRGLAGEAWASFAVFLGNPRAPGERWLILLFAPDGTPLFVVKAGVKSEARALIDRELAALDALPQGTPGLPRVRERWTGAESTAFALDYVAGASPRVADDDAQLALILKSWIDPQRRVTLADIPAWQRTRAISMEGAAIEWAFADRVFHPVIFHGDFAPWNVKSFGDAWTVLDWERGSATGMPAWDWFHFVIQPALLVERLAPQQVLKRISRLMRSTAFQAYTAAAEVAGLAEALFRGYLLYLTEVVRPVDRLESMRALRELAFNSRPTQG